MGSRASAGAGGASVPPLVPMQMQMPGGDVPNPAIGQQLGALPSPVETGGAPPTDPVAMLTPKPGETPEERRRREMFLQVLMRGATSPPAAAQPRQVSMALPQR